MPVWAIILLSSIGGAVLGFILGTIAVLVGVIAATHHYHMYDEDNL